MGIWNILLAWEFCIVRRYPQNLYNICFFFLTLFFPFLDLDAGAVTMS